MKKTISKTELEIMEYLWSIGHEVTAREIRDSFTDRCWSKQTITSFLTHLRNCGYVGVRKHSPIQYFYYPIISKDEYEVAPAREVLDTVFKGSYSSMFCALAKPSHQKDDIEKIRKLLAEYEDQHNTESES